MAQPAPAALTEQVSRCIVFLESKQRPDKVAAFVAAARDDSVNRPPDVEALHGLLRRQPDLDLSTVSYGSSAVLSVLLLHLAAIAPLVNSAHYDAFLLLQGIADPGLRHAALRAEIEALDLVVGDLLTLLGRWCQPFELDEVCAHFAQHVLRPRDPTAPCVQQDGPHLTSVLREMVLAWCAEKKRPLASVVLSAQ